MKLQLQFYECQEVAIYTVAAYKISYSIRILIALMYLIKFEAAKYASNFVMLRILEAANWNANVTRTPLNIWIINNKW